jgi:DNA-binding CsgD family transcriptional regulator
MSQIELRPPADPRATPCQVPADGVPDPGARWGDLLEGMPFGIALVSRCGRVGAINGAAREAVASGRHAIRCADGVLDVAPGWGAEPWWQALRDAVEGAHRLIRLGDALPVGLSPCTDADGRAAAVCTFAPGPTYLVSVAAAYGATHRLTDSETAVVAGLVVGLAPKRIAQMRGSTESTVRSQFKQVLAKTGCHGLRELVGEVLRQPPLLAGRRVGPDARPGEPVHRSRHLTIVADSESRAARAG